MNIALDYDETYVNDKILFDSFVKLALHRGHDIKFVTGRYSTAPAHYNEDIVQDSEALGINIIFCDGEQKQSVCKDIGWGVDVWIDDHPLGIPDIHKMHHYAKGRI